DGRKALLHQTAHRVILPIQYQPIGKFTLCFTPAGVVVEPQRMPTADPQTSPYTVESDVIINAKPKAGFEADGLACRIPNVSNPMLSSTRPLHLSQQLPGGITLQLHGTIGADRLHHVTHRIVRESICVAVRKFRPYNAPEYVALNLDDFFGT